MLDWIALHHAMLWYDFFQQHSKFWNVPLSITQSVKKSALGIFGRHLECRIERSARGDHAQFFVEHKNRLANRVDNALSKCARVSDGSELFPEVRWLHSASATYLRTWKMTDSAYWIIC